MTPDQIAKNGEFSEEDLKREALDADALEKVSGGVKGENGYRHSGNELRPPHSGDQVIVHSKEDVIIVPGK